MKARKAKAAKPGRCKQAAENPKPAPPCTCMVETGVFEHDLFTFGSKDASPLALLMAVVSDEPHVGHVAFGALLRLECEIRTLASLKIGALNSRDLEATLLHMADRDPGAIEIHTRHTAGAS